MRRICINWPEQWREFLSTTPFVHTWSTRQSLFQRPDEVTVHFSFCLVGRRRGRWRGNERTKSCSSTDETRRRIEMKLKLSRFLPNNELHSYLAKSHHLLRIRSSATTELRPTTEADLIIFNFANVTQSEKFLRDVSCLCHRSFRDHLAQVVGVRSSHVNNIRYRQAGGQRSFSCARDSNVLQSAPVLWLLTGN